MNHLDIMSFNTQPPEGGWGKTAYYSNQYKGFNTQPPEGGWLCVVLVLMRQMRFQHTAARRRLADIFDRAAELEQFQHTAARRRLAPYPLKIYRY